MKSTQKLDYSRLGEALAERKLVDRAAVEHILQQCLATGALMPDLLVRERLISDWDLCRVVSELYGLPFLPVATYPPAEHVLLGLDPDYLRQYGLVPLDRFGKVLTVLMPGLVPTDVLDALAEKEKVTILPAVGTVEGNRLWLDAHLPPPSMPVLERIQASLPQPPRAGASKQPGAKRELGTQRRADPESLADWAGIFDAGDEAVQDELRRQGP